MAKLFISEVLCFIFNKYGQFTKTQLQSALVRFYTEDELISGKDVLRGHLTELVTTSSLGLVVTRYVKRPANDNRTKMTADDLWELATFTDENGLLKDLPTYVAVRLDRIPTVKVEDLDVFCIMKKLDRMESRLLSLESTNMKEVVSKIDKVETRMNMPNSKSTTTQSAQVGPIAAHVSSVHVPSSDTATSPPTSDDWEVPLYHRQKIHLRGTKALDTSEAAISEAVTIRAVPRQKVLAAYAVPRVKQNYFKFWWDEECDALKDESISSHRAWVAAGKPHDGAIANAMRKPKYAYKHAFKRKRCQEHNSFTNELHEA